MRPRRAVGGEIGVEMRCVRYSFTSYRSHPHYFITAVSRRSMASCHFHAITITVVHASWACCNLWTKENVLFANRRSQNDRYLFTYIVIKCMYLPHYQMYVFASYALQVYPCTAVDKVVKTYVKLHRLLQSHLHDIDLPILSQGIIKFLNIVFNVFFDIASRCPSSFNGPEKRTYFQGTKFGSSFTSSCS